MPWGPFEIDLDNPLGDSEETPWFKLHTIYEYLYDGEPIPYTKTI